MAITHKFLKALGIEEDKAEEILTAHLETVNAIKAERDELKSNKESATHRHRAKSSAETDSRLTPSQSEKGRFKPKL